MTESDSDADREREAPYQLRGTSFTMMVLRLIDPEAPGFFSQLSAKLDQAPNFYANAPVILDLDGLASERSFHLPGLVRRLRSLNLVPVGVHGGTATQQEAAATAGLPVLPAGRSTRFEPPRAEAAAAPPPAPKPSLVIPEPVRSGRQIYAEGTSLVVLAPVSPGAEVVADGDIHVHGPLRGRAIAGLKGERGARIVCGALEAEMVSIAGRYRVNEDFDPDVAKKPVHISLVGDALTIAAYRSG